MMGESGHLRGNGYLFFGYSNFISLCVLFLSRLDLFL